MNNEPEWILRLETHNLTIYRPDNLPNGWYIEITKLVDSGETSARWSVEIKAGKQEVCVYDAPTRDAVLQVGRDAIRAYQFLTEGTAESILWETLADALQALR